MMERLATQDAVRPGANATGMTVSFLAQTGIIYLFHFFPVIVIILLWISEKNGNPK